MPVPTCLPAPSEHSPPRSYVRYSYFGVALNELQGLVLTCTPQELA